MISLLGFALACVAIAALLGVATSLCVIAAAAVSRPVLHGVSPSLRGDVVFLAGVLPAVVAMTGTAAAVWPPIASALGLVSDHCLQHGHHLHICIVHRAALQPTLVAVGGIALTAWVVRCGALLGNLILSNRRTHEIERLGTATSAPFPVVRLPGAPWLCHAVGAFRRRILLSESLANGLPPGALRCALAHETAHLSRRDPLASLVMSIAGLFALPFWSGVLLRAYRSAAEEACDDAAARAVGDGALVAEALVAVASLQHSASVRPLVNSFCFGQHPLETRVRRLLFASGFEVRRALALPLAACVASGALALALQHAPAVHHAVETALHLFL
jgi:Zn-dependent protease with chaperone function